MCNVSIIRVSYRKLGGCERDDHTHFNDCHVHLKAKLWLFYKSHKVYVWKDLSGHAGDFLNKNRHITTLFLICWIPFHCMKPLNMCIIVCMQ